MIQTIWTIAKDLKWIKDQPQVIVQEINAHDIKLIQPGDHYCRFILLKVRNVGERTARGCLGHLEDENGNEFKLHWSDESWDFRRNSAPKITLEPTEPRDLDVAFSIYGNLKPVVSITSSDPVIYATQTELDRLPGTLIPSTSMLGTHNVPPFDNIRFFLPVSPRKGAWVATPSVPHDLPENCREHLSPVIHKMKIRIILSEARGFNMEFDIVSGEKPWALNVEKDSVEWTVE
jgi:hypothetical protein